MIATDSFNTKTKFFPMRLSTLGDMGQTSLQIVYSSRYLKQ